MKYILVMLICYWPCSLFAQNDELKFKNVEIDSIRKQVKITYDILEKKAVDVKLRIFYNGKEVANPTLSFESYDFNKGTNKIVYWDVKEDGVFVEADFRFELYAFKKWLKPTPKWVHWSAGSVAFGGLLGSSAVALNFKNQVNKLNELANTVDPDGDGQILNTTLNDQWRDQYTKTQTAAKPQLSNALLGVFALAAGFEIYAILHDIKAKKSKQRLSFAPSHTGLGFSLSYHLNKQKP
jgi:hypothetical protein